MRVALVCSSLLLPLALSGAVGARAQDGGKRNAAESATAHKQARLGAPSRAHKPDAREAQREAARALRKLERALAAAPSEPLLLRYAALGLPLGLPEGARHEAALRHAADVFTSALDRHIAEVGGLPLQLTLAAVWAHALRGELESSLALAQRAARADDPQTVPCLRAVAALSLLAGQYSAARSALTLARSFAPSDPALSSELGWLLLAEGDTEAALPPLAERFALDPSSLLSRRDLAYALSAAGRPAEGFSLLQVATADCSEEPLCLLEQARWAFEAGLLGEALALTRTLLSREPAQLDALFLAADALLAQGNLGAARTVYQTILRIAPDNLRAKNALSGLPGSAPGSR